MKLRSVLTVIPIAAGAALYGFALWVLSRLLCKAGFPRRHAVPVLGFAILGDHVWARWEWMRLLDSLVPTSGFPAFVMLVFAMRPSTTTPANISADSTESFV